MDTTRAGPDASDLWDLGICIQTAMWQLQSLFPTTAQNHFQRTILTRTRDVYESVIGIFGRDFRKFMNVCVADNFGLSIGLTCHFILIINGSNNPNMFISYSSLFLTNLALIHLFKDTVIYNLYRAGQHSGNSYILYLSRSILPLLPSDRWSSEFVIRH
ncbi:MAG: hypothetical protein K9M07_03200 [Simkaniaceae bacterium]|nr:hypothetical protein [Simkaniaceae bacterium]MCF7852230.1 hypothetical protein [Simkaniaceae bacterium]